MTTVVFLASLLRGGDVPPEAWTGVDTDELLKKAERHSLLPLVADALRGQTGVPPALQDVLQREASRQAARDLSREAALRQLLDALAVAGIDALVFKGAHLAYSVYRRPDLRPRADSDLLVSPARRVHAHEVLLRLGYEAVAHVQGELVSHQVAYRLRRGPVAVHEVDLHWRLFNPEAFADLPAFDALWLRAQPLPGLGPSARGLGPLDALLTACVHRAAHHYGSSLLIWFHDIHLLARSLDPEQWAAFVAAAGDAHVAAICRRGLRHTTRWFDTPVPDEVFADLQGLADRGGGEQSAAYLSPVRRPIQDLVSNLKALPTWLARARLIREHLLPGERYMRDVYAPSNRAPLSILYAWRAMRGARKWLARR